MTIADSQINQSDRYLGLSFSGGGYRAAAFSLGVLALLKDLSLLGRATVLSGVSGGSIALGAYLCAKAGSDFENHEQGDDDPCFYEKFYKKFIAYLSTEEMAEGFVHFSWLLQNRKLIKAAAEANHALFTDLLGQPALLGSDRIRELLNNGQRSPDYAFFNAANISTLNLFRFGLQKHRSSGHRNDIAIVLGRWILTPQACRNTTRDLYGFSQQLRVADCVAASHAFPVGLEPMVFPDDFFLSGDEGPKAVAAFAGSDVCERKQAVALLDGGLYDNLGLASVEDIRENLYPKAEHALCAPFVVIATDVDNIQSGISFYDASQNRKKRGKQGSIMPRFIILALGVVVGVFALSSPAWGISAGLRGEVVGIILALLPTLRIKQRKGKLQIAGPRWSYAIGLIIGISIGSAIYFVQANQPAPATAAILLPIAILMALPGALHWLRGALKPFLRKLLNRLGFSDSFVESRSQSDSQDLGSYLALRTFFGKQCSNLIETLRFNLLVQRAGQPGPMFSGYLKRTRSLTYGYLEGRYQRERQTECGPRPHLVRNMIFELTQGADADPDYAAELITLPVQTLSTLNQEQEEGYHETSVMRKVRHAHFAAGLIQQKAGLQTDVLQRALPGRHDCLLKIWEAGRLNPESQASDGQDECPDCTPDQQLDQLIKRLELTQAAQLWDELWPALRVGPGSCESTPQTRTSPDMQRLLAHVCMLLQRALRQPDIHEGTVLENCRISPDPIPAEYSWIPLICEMATNLPTTLWIQGYRYYVPNSIVDGRTETLGAWFSRKPKQDELKGRPLLDLGMPEVLTDSTQTVVCPATAITTLAGYITTVFNLLEYYYSYLQYSDAFVNGLARTLASQSQGDQAGCFEPFKDCSCQKAVLDLPFALRQRVDQQLHEHWQWVQTPPRWWDKKDQDKPRRYDHDLRIKLEKLMTVTDPQVRLDLLRPWLRSRGSFPPSWWKGCDEAEPSAPPELS